ncbi:MAG: hypothetical protein FWC79_00340 [Oscillospiraceae bacterium]|nr:hypothetical protein [Oscillospiraceae bacterium]
MKRYSELLKEWVFQNPKKAKCIWEVVNVGSMILIAIFSWAHIEGRVGYPFGLRIFLLFFAILMAATNVVVAQEKKKARKGRVLEIVYAGVFLFTAVTSALIILMRIRAGMDSLFPVILG